MIKPLIAILACASTSGCVAVGAAAAYSGSLTGVQRVAPLYFMEKRPDLDATAATACVVDNASRFKIIEVGSLDSRFLTPQNSAAYDELVADPDIATCLAELPTTAA